MFKKYIDVLKKYGIPYILRGSGGTEQLQVSNYPLSKQVYIMFDIQSMKLHASFSQYLPGGVTDAEIDEVKKGFDLFAAITADINQA